MKLTVLSKILFVILLAFTTYGCKKVGISEHRIKQNFYGNWEITKYEKNGEDLIGKSNFTRNTLLIQENDYTPYSYGSLSSGVYCNDSIVFFDVNFNFDRSTLSFEENGHCSHLDAIDPLFYFTKTTLQNNWDINYFSKRVMKINNFSSQSDADIEILFEKIKDKNYDQ